VKIEVQVKPNSRQEGVKKTEAGVYKVSVNAPPQDGRANEAVIQILSEHFGIPKSSITILRGHSGRKKLVEIAQ
jgi:uncharacterized protein